MLFRSLDVWLQDRSHKWITDLCPSAWDEHAADCFSLSFIFLPPLLVKWRHTSFSGKEPRPTEGNQMRKLTGGRRIWIRNLHAQTPRTYQLGHYLASGNLPCWVRWEVSDSQQRMIGFTIFLVLPLVVFSVVTLTIDLGLVTAPNLLELSGFNSILIFRTMVARPPTE